jgi:hypothetical protein
MQAREHMSKGSFIEAGVHFARALAVNDGADPSLEADARHNLDDMLKV